MDDFPRNCETEIAGNSQNFPRANRRKGSLVIKRFPGKSWEIFGSRKLKNKLTISREIVR